MISILVPKDTYILTIRGFIKVQELEPTHTLKTYNLELIDVLGEQILRPIPYYGHILGVESVGNCKPLYMLYIYHGSLKCHISTELLSTNKLFVPIDRLKRNSPIYMVIRGHMLVDTFIHDVRQVNSDIECFELKTDSPSVLISYDEKGTVTALVRSRQ